MSQEILYTSAPRGLKPGSRGFCTVVSTEGMAGNLAERLESLSGYRHAFPLHDSRSKHNPVNYSHLAVTVGGRTHHVLSRIADAGEDYTGRSNKIAHHVALQPSELVPAGPAAVLASPGFCETQWDGQLNILPAGRTPPPTDPTTGPCAAWQQITGDAGWGGVLAESAVQKGGRPMSVIFPAGTRTLPLVVEALNLLPPEERWNVTFSTYFTKLPAGVDCRWRFLLDDSPEAAALRRNPHAPVIDLCDDLGPAPVGEFVEAARTGRQPVPGKPLRPTLVDDDPAEQYDEPPPPPPHAEDDAGAYAIRKPKRSGRSTRRPPKAPPEFAPRPSRRRVVLFWTAMGLALLLMLSGGLVGGYFWGHSAAERELAEDRQGRGDIQVAANEANQLRNKGMPLVPGNGDEAPNGEGTHVKFGRPSNVAKSRKQPKGDKPRPKDAERKHHDHKDPKDDTKPNHKILPLDEIRNKGNLLLLPTKREAVLVTISAPAKDVELELHGGKHVLESKEFDLSARKSNEGGWTRQIRKKAKEEKHGIPDEGVPIAEFRFKDGELRFRWLGPIDNSHENRCLHCCLLKVTAGSDTELCRLAKPKQLAPIPLSFQREQKGVKKIRLPPFVDHLKMSNIQIKWSIKPKHSLALSVALPKKQSQWTGIGTEIRALTGRSQPIFSASRRMATIHFFTKKPARNNLTPANAFADLDVQLEERNGKTDVHTRHVLALKQYFYPARIERQQGDFDVSVERQPYADYKRAKWLSDQQIATQRRIRAAVESELTQTRQKLNEIKKSPPKSKAKEKRQAWQEQLETRQREIDYDQRLLSLMPRDELKKQLKELFSKKTTLNFKVFVTIPDARNKRHKHEVVLLETKPPPAPVKGGNQK